MKIFEHRSNSNRVLRVGIFDSIKEQVDYGRTVTPDGNNALRGNCYNSESFVGKDFSSFAEMDQATTDLWEEGVESVESMLKSLLDVDLPEPMDRKRRVRFDDMNGDEVDLDRLRSGMDFWRKCERQSTNAPQNLTVFIDLTASAYRDWKDLLWRGAAGLAMVKKLEENGYRVEVWAVAGSGPCYGKTYTLQGTRLKSPGDPLDMSGLINAVSGWYFRSITFHSWMAAAKPGESVRCGYGPPHSPTQDELDLFSKDEERIYISGVYTRDGALDVVRDEMKKYSELK